MIGAVRLRCESAEAVVAEAVRRHIELCGVEPNVVMTSYADAARLAGLTPLRIRPKSFIGMGTYYVGWESDERAASDVCDPF